MEMLEALLGAALFTLCLVHLTAYAIRWVLEGIHDGAFDIARIFRFS